MSVDIRDAVFDEVFNIARQDQSVVFLTADMDAFSLEKFRSEIPERYFNIGVAEQAMISIAAGLALSGKRVFIYAMVPFITARCFEHIKVDLCSMNLPVTLIGAGAGFSFDRDGPTHHGVTDVGIMRMLPELTILNPSDATSATAAVNFAHDLASPCYIRLDKGVMPDVHSKENFARGLEKLKDGSDLVMFATGTIVHLAIEVSTMLKEKSISVSVVDIVRLKPVNRAALLAEIETHDKVVVLEELVPSGGLGTIVSELLAEESIAKPLKRFSLRDEQTFQYDDRSHLLMGHGLDKHSLARELEAWSFCRQ